MVEVLIENGKRHGLLKKFSIRFIVADGFPTNGLLYLN
jgi:hypothetical protein